MDMIQFARGGGRQMMQARMGGARLWPEASLIRGGWGGVMMTAEGEQHPSDRRQLCG